MVAFNSFPATDPEIVILPAFTFPNVVSPTVFNVPEMVILPAIKLPNVVSPTVFNVPEMFAVVAITSFTIILPAIKLLFVSLFRVIFLNYSSYFFA